MTLPKPFKVPRGDRPVLIVAPKTLLGNWCEGIQFHLGAGALGMELHVYEKGLKAIKLHSGGGNATTLYRQTLDDGPEPQALLDEMIEIDRRDVPWAGGYYPKAFSLDYGWLTKLKPKDMANNL